MTEERERYRAGPAAAPEPPLTTEALIAKAHAHHQSNPYETGEQVLQRLPERLRALTDLILGGKMTVGRVAYAVTALIDCIENARVETAARRH